LILIPRLAGQACLLLLEKPSALTESQVSSCVKFTYRAFATFNYTVIGGVGSLTGANTLDVASIGVSLGLLLGGPNYVSQAFARIHNEVVVQNATRADGIRPDYSFSQHSGVLYDGAFFYPRNVLRISHQHSH
jgi:hypothetical protein